MWMLHYNGNTIRYNIELEDLVYQSVNPSTDQSVNPSIDQSVNPSIDQSVNPSTDQSINPSINRSVNPSIDQSVNPSIDQSVNPSTDQSINPSINPSINRSILVFLRWNPNNGNGRSLSPASFVKKARKLWFTSFGRDCKFVKTFWQNVHYWLIQHQIKSQHFLPTLPICLGLVDAVEDIYSNLHISYLRKEKSYQITKFQFLPGKKIKLVLSDVVSILVSRSIYRQRAFCCCRLKKLFQPGGGECQQSHYLIP